MKTDETHLIIKSSMQNDALRQGRCLVHRFRMRLHDYHASIVLLLSLLLEQEDRRRETLCRDATNYYGLASFLDLICALKWTTPLWLLLRRAQRIRNRFQVGLNK